MTRHEPQVVVVGAGPAGATTALLLARRGVNVAILDRQDFPRSKPCGECLSAQATVLLDRLGLLDRVLEQHPARLQGWRIIAPGGHAFEAPFRTLDGNTTTALALDRRRLDWALLQAALEAGAVFHRITVRDLIHQDDGVAGVTGLDPQGAPVRMRARLVVGADGLRSVVARRSGLVGRPARRRRRDSPSRRSRRGPRGPRGGKVSLTAHAENPGRAWPTSPGLGEMHLAPGACVGIAPVDARSGTLNLSMVVQDRSSLKGVDLHAFFAARLRDFPRLRERLNGQTELSLEAEIMASGPFHVRTRNVIARGVALVGDAAGYFDPFTGQGVFRALAGAELLAPIVQRALSDGTGGRGGLVDLRALGPYAEGNHHLVGWPRRLQRLIDTVVTRPRLADAAIARLARVPELAEALVAVTGDMRPVESLLSVRLLFRLLQPSVQVPNAPGGTP